MSVVKQDSSTTKQNYKTLPKICKFRKVEIPTHLPQESAHHPKTCRAIDNNKMSETQMLICNNPIVFMISKINSSQIKWT